MDLRFYMHDNAPYGHTLDVQLILTTPGPFGRRFMSMYKIDATQSIDLQVFKDLLDKMERQTSHNAIESMHLMQEVDPMREIKRRVRTLEKGQDNLQGQVNHIERTIRKRDKHGKFTKI